MENLTAAIIVDHARMILDAADFCFLTTLDQYGEPTSRLVQHFKPDADLTLWFGTSIQTRKAIHLQQRPRLLVACLNPTAPAYVVLHGGVLFINEPRLRLHYWRDSWQSYWPEGPLADDYTVIEFHCDRIELMDLDTGIAPEPYGLAPAVVVRNNYGWQMVYPEST